MCCGFTPIFWQRFFGQETFEAHLTHPYHTWEKKAIINSEVVRVFFPMFDCLEFPKRCFFPWKKKLKIERTVPGDKGPKRNENSYLFLADENADSVETVFNALTRGENSGATPSSSRSFYLPMKTIVVFNAAAWFWCNQSSLELADAKRGKFW